MKARVYIDRLFDGYEMTSELQDFKEEVMVNLEERIKSLQEKGIPEDEAFNKATSELGNVSEIADEMSRQKRKEVIGKMYLDQDIKLSTAHVIGYVASVGAILFGIIAGAIIYFSNGDLSGAVAAFFPFFVPASSVLVFLSLNQETNREFPMSWKRALLYTLATGAFLFGINASLMLYLSKSRDLVAVAGILLAFLVPAICLFTYLGLTEKSRNKPWVVDEMNMWKEHKAGISVDPKLTEKRGLLSAALWLFSIALFIALGLWIGFKYSWVVFLFTVGAEVLIEYWVRANHKI